MTTIVDFVNSLNSAFKDIGTDMQFKADLINGKVPLSQLPPQTSGDFVARSEMGAANGVATLDGGGIIEGAQLPATALTSDIPLTQKGVANGVASLGSDGKVPSNQLPTLGGGTGSGEMTLPNFVDHFGGNPNGVANNDAAFTAAEASSFQRIWLPKGRYITTKDPQTLFKRYEGSGTIQFSVVDNSYNRPRTNSRVYKKVFATTASDTVNIGTNEPLAQDFGEIEYVTIPAGSRSDLDTWANVANAPTGRPKYYWAPAMPKATFFISDGGESGVSGNLAANLAVGATTATIVGGVNGWNVGDVVGFIPTVATALFGGPADGFAGDTKTITNVDLTNGRFSWSGGLVNAYTAGMIVTKGYRTMNTANFVQMEASGGGDHNIWLGRIRMKRALLDSQTNIFAGAGSTMIGGDVVAYADYNAGYGCEIHYDDQAHPSAMFGTVSNYSRKSISGLRGCVWLHDLIQMPELSATNTVGSTPTPSGFYPLDGLWVAKSQARVGLDLTACRFQVAAIAIPINEKLGFFANQAWTAPDATNGNGWVATKVGGNIHGATDGFGDNLTHTIHGPGGGGAGGNQMILRQAGLQTFKHIGTNQGFQIGWGEVGNNTLQAYLTFNGSNIQVVVNGSVRATF